ncbi:MAG: F0F1 ATP synthase subunit delta, partial [bacterium]
MKKKKVAMRYSKALLLLGETVDQRELYLDELNRFLLSFREDPQGRKFLLSPIFSTRERKKALGRISDTLGFSRITRNFLQVLIDNDRLSEIENIVMAYREMVDERSGRVRVVIRSASAVSSPFLEKIRT